jgi:hypothetical protein
MEFFSRPVSKLIHRAKTVILVFISVGCIEPYVPSIIVEDHNYLVVEGFLVENDTTVVRLSRTQVIADPVNFQGESQAMVEIEGENGDHYILAEKQKGIYVVPPLDIDRSVNYRLRVRTRDDHEYLSDFVPAKFSHVLDSVAWEEDLAHDAIQFNVYSHDPENNTHYYYWTYDETWKYVSSAISVYYYENGKITPRKNSTELYNCWKTNFNANFYLQSTTGLIEDIAYDSKLFSIPQSSRKLYFGYSILVKQYTLTKDAFDYWTITKKNSESLGSLFDSMPSQAKSNIRCNSNPDEPVIGHFSVTTVQKRRVFFTRQQVSGPASKPYDATGYEYCEGQGSIIPPDQISDNSLAGKLIHDTLYHPETGEFLGYIVTRTDCLDCRRQGGINIQPDYWK